MEEVYKSIREYSGLYEVSNLGNVRSVDRIVKDAKKECVLKGRLLVVKYAPYAQITLSIKGKRKHHRNFIWEYA